LDEKIPQLFGGMSENLRGEFFWLTLYEVTNQCWGSQCIMDYPLQVLGPCPSSPQRQHQIASIHRVRKKRVWSISGITSSNPGRFSKFLHTHNLLKICKKKPSLNIPPHLKRVATLPCENWCQKAAARSVTSFCRAKLKFRYKEHFQTVRLVNVVNITISIPLDVQNIHHSPAHKL